MSIEGSAMSIVVDPSAPEAFTPRELTNADKDFTQRVPQYLDAETGIKASAYGYGERVLIVYEESGEGIVILIHRSAWNTNSANFASPPFSEVG